MSVKRIYVEKKTPYAVSARKLADDIKGFLGIDGVKSVRVLIRYDIENLSDEVYEQAKGTIFSEPPVALIWCWCWMAVRKTSSCQLVPLPRMEGSA